MEAVSRRRPGEMPAPVSIYTLAMDPSTTDITERKKQFFQRLRSETADLHRQTEGSRLSVALMNENLSTADYRNYLLRMKDIVEYYENVLFSKLTNIIPDIEQRRKLHLVENDLASLTAENTTQNFSLPQPGSTATLLGYMYVLEGSTLGGAMIYKHVSRYLPVTEEKGGQYFTSYQSQLSAKWKSFLDILGEHSLDEQQANEIIAGAKIAFSAICKHLS
jgi:heme oxygenase (biliverdin-IX-beta and delta-forming)